MRAELIAIGSELLLGDHVDTNSAWLSSRLAEIGVDVHRHTTVGDNPSRLIATLREAADRADIVITGGGLGPTQDDLTRFAVAELAGVELERRDELVEWVREHFARGRRQMPERNIIQADLPIGATVIPPIGTAAGFAVDVPGAGDPTRIYCLPGVPGELTRMTTDHVIPDIAARGDLATTVSRLVRTSGMSESGVADIAADLVDRLEERGNPTIAFLASKGETRVRVTGKADDRADALALVDPVVDELLALLGTGVVGVDDEGAEHAVARALLTAGWTLGVAESVTGGGVGARLVRVPGATRWLRGVLVPYSTDVKSSPVVGMDAEVLAAEGPVSEATAGALAEAARERLGADVGLAIVGVAGPDTQDDVDVGTVCIGVVVPGAGVRTWQRRLPVRDRADLQEFAASVAIDALRRAIADTGPGWLG